jgi:NADH:ubiquinone oxidoreductase subunit 2 (subunit N)
MLATFLAQAGDWVSPTIDWHAIAPELVLAIGINIILALDLQLAETKKWMISTITGFVLLAAFVPVVTLAVVGDDSVRSLFDGRYVIDDYALVLKGLFLLVAYVVVLMSQTELEEGGYYQGEFYVLMLCSVLGMVMMASARDLVSIFVALMTLIFIAFPGADEVYEPLVWVMAALTMTIGNVLALRQTNIVRMLAYSSISQGGFILMPLAFAGNSDATGSAMNAVMVYLLVYAFMNLGAFAIVIAVSRKTNSGEISSFGGLFGYAPGLAVAMTILFASLAGIPPLGGWFAKFNAFKAVLDAGTTAAYVLAAIAAVNTVIAAAYYMRVLRVVWMDDAPDGDTSPVNPPAPVVAALAITVVGTLVVGVLPNLVARVGALDALTGAFAG